MFKRTEVAKLNCSKAGALNLAKFNENESYLGHLSHLRTFGLLYKLEILFFSSQTILTVWLEA